MVLSDDVNKDVLAAIGFTIATLTSLNAFLGWDRIWRGRRQAEAALEHQLSIWEIEVLRAVHMKDATKADAHVLAATKELLASSHSVTLSEGEQFFEQLGTAGGASSASAADQVASRAASAQ